MCRAKEFTFASTVFDLALVEINRSFLRLYDVQQGYLCRSSGQIEATSNPSLGANDAIFDQGLEYFGKKGRGDILCFADILFKNDPPGWLAGHVKDGTDRVFCCSSNNQKEFLLLTFLTSFVIKVIVLNDYVNHLSGYRLSPRICFLFIWVSCLWVWIEERFLFDA